MRRDVLLVIGALLFAVLMLASVVYDIATGDYSQPPLPHSAEIRHCRESGGIPEMRVDWNGDVIVCRHP